ncbi:hypothetical protein A0H81_08018 [Grifola frondosa]|uniref:Uncharacterized protein n=1 Tax=Grifola frondosa TaxID=5627 RepID=A0A1C7M6T7_GRIFR|nr:hypothetical protein A0H81_08018 [Grifola frondosa]
MALNVRHSTLMPTTFTTLIALLPRTPLHRCQTCFTQSLDGVGILLVFSQHCANLVVVCGGIVTRTLLRLAQHYQVH